MKNLSRLTALLLALVMLLSITASATEGISRSEFEADDYNTMLSNVQTYGLIDSAYQHYVDELVAMDVAQRYETLKRWHDGLLGPLFYERFISYYTTTYPDGNLICTCAAPVEYGTTGHDADCPWNFENLTIAEQYELSKDMSDEDKANLSAETLDALARVNATEYTTVNEGANVSINVPEGAFAEDYQLEVTPVTVNDALQSAIDAVMGEETSSPVGAFDISFAALSGEGELQPAEGTPVELTFDVSENGLYIIYHMVENGNGGYTAEIAEFNVVEDGKISVDANSFSIYIVSEIGNTNSIENVSTQNNGTYNMTLGDATKIFYTNASNGSYGEWRVDDDEGVISYTVSANNTVSGGQFQARWIAVTPKKVGTATLTYVRGTGDSGTQTSATLTINVSAPTGFYVADSVAESGCLVPTGLTAENVTYVWSRSDGQQIRSEALNEDGTVNISLDRGGVTSGRDPITYTVTAIAADGVTTIATAEYEVLYGNEILNSSFETPSVGNGAYIYNGYPGLYWKTTAPGSGSGHITQDIEILTENNSSSLATYFGTSVAADGEQFVELNAEAIGTLYQDILTTSGATLTWSFSHAARTKPSGSNNAMFVVVAATKDAQNVVSASDISSLLGGLDVEDMPTSGAGYVLTKNGVTYRVWGHEASNRANVWENVSGTYEVPEGQYLTRLFFASDPNNSVSDPTCGNLIDATSAGEHMSYTIAYYPDDQLASSKTESGNGTLYTTVTPQNLQDYLDDGYVITGVTVNGKNYSGDITKGLYITEYKKAADFVDTEGFGSSIILKVILKKQAITITKKVEIAGWDSLDEESRTALMSDYTATFNLLNGSTVAATATAHIAYTEGSTLTVLAEFKQSNGSVPAYGTYTFEESSTSEIEGYALTETTFDKTSVTINSNNPNASVTCTNKYEVSFGSLTITKMVVNADGQSFIFDVTCEANDYSAQVVITGAGSVTLVDLEPGDYTVTEDTSWSWRFEPAEGVSNPQTVTVTGGDAKNIEFTNTAKPDKWLSDESAKVNTFATVTE